MKRKTGILWLLFVVAFMVIFGGCGGGGGNSSSDIFPRPNQPSLPTPANPTVPDPSNPVTSPGDYSDLEGDWVGIPSQSSGSGVIAGIPGTLSLVEYSARVALRPGSANEINVGPTTCIFIASGMGYSQELDNSYSGITEECVYLGNNQYRWGYPRGKYGSYSETVTVTVHSNTSATMVGSAEGSWYGYSGNLNYTIRLQKR